MSVEYRLTLGGDLPLDEISARALPDPGLRPTPYKDFLTADLFDQFGFLLDIVGEQDSYYSAPIDSGTWEWEPARSADVTFKMTRDPDRQDSTQRNILEIAVRLLNSGTEDAAFMVNGDTLLLTRMNGQSKKFSRKSWWDCYGYTSRLIPN